MPDPIFINGRFLAQPITGVQRYAREVVRALDALLREGVVDAGGAEVTLLTPCDGVDVPPLERIRVRRAGRLAGHAWEQFELPVLSRAGVLLNLCNTGPLACRRQVVTLHDAAVYRVPAAYTRVFRTWYRVLWAGLARTAPTILTVSYFSRRELADCLGIDRSRIGVVEEAGDHILAVPPDAGVLDRHGLRARPFVLAVSTANPTKNFGVVVRAIERLGETDFDFVVAGGVDPRVFARAAAPLPAAVKRVGYVSDGELRALYEHAACFVHPSRYEGFGLPPLEAMCCGCPVLAAEAASIPEVCGDAALYFDPGSPADLAGKLDVLMAHPAARAALAARGRDRAARFSWRRAAAANWEEVQRVAGGQPAVNFSGRAPRQARSAVVTPLPGKSARSPGAPASRSPRGSRRRR
jgi:glycosyltransferase involved in cell wall biosynthesis